MKKALFIGRFTPPHKGHIEAIIKLLTDFDKITIGIGSCYEVGTERHPFLAIFREKMILNSLARNNCDLTKIELVHIPDFETFEEWINNIIEIGINKEITHFVTGNEKDILSVLEDKKIKLPFKLINPELNSTIPYHASDLREAIKVGDYDKFIEIAANGTVELMANVNGFNGIREALQNKGPVFFSGRQTVDVVFTISEQVDLPNGKHYKKKYILCGIRSSSKDNFPNYLGLPGSKIEKFESPINAALRAIKEKSNINVSLLNNTLEPAHILVEKGDYRFITDLKFLKLFNSDDPNLAGKYGGSSQCFFINIDANHELFNNLNGNDEFSEVKFIPIYEGLEIGFAYQQTEMVKLALDNLNNFDYAKQYVKKRT